MLKLITNANVHAPEALGICHLLVAGERIVYIGPDLPALDDRLEVAVTDLDGATVVPGFIDMHAHITGGGGESGPSSRVPPVFLTRFTRAGVTSVIGVLGTDDLTRNTQTIVTQAYGLREEGISAWCHTGGYHVPLTTLTGNARSDIVFIDPIIGVGELAISDHRSSQPTLDEFLRIASDAHVAGLMTGKAGVVHIHMGDGDRGLAMIREALDKSEIPARVFNPTHVNRNKRLFDEALSLPERGCRIDLTAFPKDHVGEGWSAAEAFLIYRDRGLPESHITISSDGGGCLPVFDHDGELERLGVGTSAILPETLRDLVNSGNVPLAEALPAITSNVAALLRLHGKGRLEKGRDADLVVLDDRLEVRDVMARGQWHIRSGEPQVWGTYERD